MDDPRIAQYEQERAEAIDIAHKLPRGMATLSNIGLPGPCVEDHFDPSGLCQCPCEECTTRTAKFCVCPDCRCESNADHTAWVWRDLAPSRSDTP